jgi:DNA-binding MarR family transcriptional regulator
MNVVKVATRGAALEEVYQELSTLVRRSEERSAELHPGLSVVMYTLLVEIDADPAVRAADLAAHFGLDKSTVSRQLDQLETGGLIARGPERPGRRGQTLALTILGRRRLSAGGAEVRARLAQWLDDWTDQEIADLARLAAKFNQARSGNTRT